MRIEFTVRGGGFMFKKLNLTMPDWQKNIIKIVSFVIICLFTFLIFMSVGAVIITKIDTAESFLIPFTTVLCAVSSFTDSFILSKIKRENGLIIGLSTGIVFCIIILVLSKYYNSFHITPLLGTKIAAIIISGALGGILGVNT